MWEWSLPEFAYLADNAWTGTEKIDGTNIRIYHGGQFEGRTDNAQIPAFLLPVLEGVRNKLRESELPPSTVLYGEGYGQKIQSGGHYIPDGNAFCLFDVSICGNFQTRESVIGIADQLSLSVAPEIGVYTLTEWVRLISSGQFKESILHQGARNEGVVLRPLVELENRCGNRIITKLKFKDFQNGNT